MGAADRAQVRSNAVIVPLPRSVTCGNVGCQAACTVMCPVVVLGVGGSSPLAHPMGLPTELPVWYRQNCFGDRF